MLLYFQLFLNNDYSILINILFITNDSIKY